MMFRATCLHVEVAGGGLGVANWTPGYAENGLTSSVELLWQKYFKDPSAWWDNRENKLHVKSPDFRHKTKKEALWIHSWNTPQWVTEALKQKTQPERLLGGSSEGGTISCGDCRTGSASNLIFRTVDEFSWTRVISLHVKAGRCRQALQVYGEMQQSAVKPSSFTFVAALRACSVLQNLEKAKQIHAEVVKNGFESVVYLANTLVDVYAKCGSLVDARSVFEKIPHRTVVSWNTMITGYANMKGGDEALQLYTRMRQEGVSPDDRTFVGVLKACSSLAAAQEGNKGNGECCKAQWLEEVRAIHSDVIKSGVESDTFVGNMLVDVYVKCGSLVDARHVFERMPSRDVISWTTIILGYAQLEEGKEALQMFKQMQEVGVAPNDRTFVAALKACSSMASNEVSNEADEILLKKQCLDHIKDIHSKALKNNVESDVFVGTMLVDAYAKCGRLVDARGIFERMAQRNVVSWTAMILGYAQVEEGEEALRLYEQMQQEGVVPNDRTFIAALRACSSLAGLEEDTGFVGTHLQKRCLEQVRDIHREAVTSGYESDVFLGNMLVDAYSKCGNLVDARCVFDKMPHRDVVSWNAMISGYAQMEEGEEALKLYAQMQKEGLAPNLRTFVGALKACNMPSAIKEVRNVDRQHVNGRFLDQVRAIHCDYLKSETKADRFVDNMLIDAYSKCRSLVDARLVFERMQKRDVVSWNTMILGYAQMERGEEALQLYAQMQGEGVPSDYCTFIAALKACSSVTGLDKGKEIHAAIVQNGLDLADSFLANSLIDMYGKCGSMVHAQQVFDEMLAKDVVTWNALIAGHSRQGDSDLVFHSFHRMREAGLQPDGITFLSVLTVCSHVGLVDKGQEYFEAMTGQFGISPTIGHFTCLIDLLGRAGQVKKAMTVAKTMPFQPDGAVWETLLGACQKWSNVEVGRQAFEFAVRLERSNATAYVLMSNIYAAACLWEEVKEIQALLRKARAMKQRGQSWWTDIGGSVHAFSVRGSPSMKVARSQHPEDKRHF